MKSKLVFLLVLSLVVIAPWTVAQTGKGSISGRITDPSGAVVPGVDVTITNRSTGVATKTKTNHDGYYEVNELLPDNYDIEVKAPNFKTVVHNNIVLQVEDRLTVDIRLEVGQVTETMVVTTEAPQLRTADAETGEVIDQNMIENLPSNNTGFARDPLLLLSISGDVQGGGQRAGWALGINGGGPYSGPNDTRINGGRTSSLEYLVDGVPISQNFGHVISNGTPAYDDVSEFKVVTNGISAEYGRLSGGAVSIGTKSGSNSFHRLTGTQAFAHQLLYV